MSNNAFPSRELTLTVDGGERSVELSDDEFLRDVLSRHEPELSEDNPEIEIDPFLSRERRLHQLRDPKHYEQENKNQLHMDVASFMRLQRDGKLPDPMSSPRWAKLRVWLRRRLLRLWAWANNAVVDSEGRLWYSDCQRDL